MSTPLRLEMLLNCGYTVKIFQGRILVYSVAKVLKELNQHEQIKLAEEIAPLLEIPLLTYQGHNVGLYSVNRSTKKSGLTMMMSIIGKPQDGAYCMFNVDTHYERNSTKHKAGDPLPKNHFRVARGSKFNGLWLACGLTLPDGGKRSCFHRYMGKLKGIIFTGNPTPSKPERFADLSPVTVDHATIQAAYRQRNTASSFPNLSLIRSHTAPKLALTVVPKESAPSQKPWASNSNVSTDQNSTNKGKQYKVNHNAYKAVKEGYLTIENKQQPQSANSEIDDWLADYDAADTI